MPPKAAHRRRPARQSAGSAHKDQVSTNTSEAEIPETGSLSTQTRGLQQDDAIDLDASNATEPAHSHQLETSIGTSRQEPIQGGETQLDSSETVNNSAEPPSTSVKSKPFKYKPKSALRRSKAEREALEREEAERQALRQRLESSTASRAGYHARGGLDRPSHWRKTREQQAWQASGVLGGDTRKEKPIRAKRGGTSIRSGTSGRQHDMTVEGADAASVDPKPRRRAVDRVKKEDGNNPESEKESDGDVVMDSTKRKRKATATKRKVKQEDEQQESLSDDARWDDDAGPKLEIAQISLISDEEDGDDEVAESEASKGKQRERTPHPSAFQLRPVRLERREHVEHHIGINTDASSLTSAELRRRAKERNKPDEPLFIPEDDTAMIFDAAKKARRKPRDVEFLWDERRWKGVFEDDEDLDETVIKREPTEEDEVMVTVVPTATRHGEAMDLDDEQAAHGVEASTSMAGATALNAERITEKGGASPRSNIRRPKVPGYQNPPSIQALFEDYEHDKDFAEMISIFKEVQEDQKQSGTALDGASLYATAHPDLSDLKGNPARETKVFVMQLPPVMPKLVEFNKRPNPFAITPPVKPDPELHKAVDGAQTEQTMLNTDGATPINVLPISPIAGCPGTLKINESGQIKASWGGLDLHISQSYPAGFAQEILLFNYDYEWEDIGEKEENDKPKLKIKITVGEEAHSMGAVDEGFVAVPGWDGLLGV